jgi:vacuolar-type H+-ATPase subunit E/Vma4
VADTDQPVSTDAESSNKRHRSATGRLTAVVLGAAGVSTGLGFVVNIASETVPSTWMQDSPWPWIVAAVLVAATSTVGLLLSRASARAGRAATESREAFQEAAAQVVDSVEKTLPGGEPSLEDELAQVSASLSATVSRLRQVSAKAEAFETEVQQLVARAEAAKATASLHEDDARRIGQLLGSQTEAHLRTEIQKLTIEYDRQIEQLRRSGNRTAVWTFVGGVVLGIIGNIVVALWMS